MSFIEVLRQLSTTLRKQEFSTGDVYLIYPEDF